MDVVLLRAAVVLVGVLLLELVVVDGELVVVVEAGELVVVPVLVSLVIPSAVVTLPDNDDDEDDDDVPGDVLPVSKESVP